jgi:hypothetical protein
MQAWIGDAYLDRHCFQEWGIGQAHPHRAEISTNVEVEPVAARDEVITGQQRFAHPPVSIGQNGFEALPDSIFNSEKIDLHSDGGPAT